MPPGSTTTGRNEGAECAPACFDEYNACPPSRETRDRWDDSRYAEWQWVNGSVVPYRVSAAPSLSELFSAYAITLDADRASSAASNRALQLAATDLEYEVTRVKPRRRLTSYLRRIPGSRN